MSGPASLQFDNVAFAYGSVAVLKGLDLRVEPGQVVGFLGVNGSGKTTTFLLATGFLAADSGQVSVMGVDPRTSKAWSSQVGVVHSGAGHYGRLSVRRNLSFFAELYGIKPDLEAHMARHGLTEYANRPAGQLSTGYRQRLSLARATLHSPRLLLLDEPSDGLDPAASEELFLLVKAFADGGGAVLMTSHRVEEVERLCQEVVLLSEGVASWRGSPSQLSAGTPGGLRAKLLALGGFSAGETLT